MCNHKIFKLPVIGFYMYNTGLIRFNYKIDIDYQKKCKGIVKRFKTVNKVLK